MTAQEALKRVLELQNNIVESAEDCDAPGFEAVSAAVYELGILAPKLARALEFAIKELELCCDCCGEPQNAVKKINQIFEGK